MTIKAEKGVETSFHITSFKRKTNRLVWSKYNIRRLLYVMLPANHIFWEYEQQAGKAKHPCQTNSENHNVFWLFSGYTQTVSDILELTTEQHSWQRGESESSTITWHHSECNQSSWWQWLEKKGAGWKWLKLHLPTQSHMPMKFMCLDRDIVTGCYLSDTLAFEWLSINRLSLPLLTAIHFE